MNEHQQDIYFVLSYVYRSDYAGDGNNLYQLKAQSFKKTCKLAAPNTCRGLNYASITSTYKTLGPSLNNRSDQRPANP